MHKTQKVRLYFCEPSSLSIPFFQNPHLLLELGHRTLLLAADLFHSVQTTANLLIPYIGIVMINSHQSPNLPLQFSFVLTQPFTITPSKVLTALPIGFSSRFTISNSLSSNCFSTGSNPLTLCRCPCSTSRARYVIRKSAGM